MQKKKLELKRQVIDLLSDVEQRQTLGNKALITEDPCISAMICTGPELCFPNATVCNSDCMSLANI